MKHTWKFVAVAAMLAGTAGTAKAQINYTTQGFFSGSATTAAGVTCTMAAALSASCTGGGFTLLYTGTSGVNLANGTITSLGTFNLTGTGTVTVPAGVLNFNLLVNQTTPSSGQGIFLGALTGTVSTAGGVNFSSLQWSPNQNASIGSVNYQLVFDNVGPSVGAIGIPINNVRGINALVTSTATPEPASLVLLGTGLVGLFGVARRKKNV